MSDSTFKPQWAYKTPRGRRPEPFLVNFSFTLDGSGNFVRGLPWSLDDDVPFVIHAILFPVVGTSSFPGALPGFVRIWDTHGNPLSGRALVESNGPELFDLALAAGVYGQSGFVETNQFGSSGINAFGFPVEPAVPCAAGGIITFDFQINTNATAGNFVLVGIADAIEFQSQIIGTISNTFTIQTIDPGAPNVPLSVALVGGLHVQVTLKTNGASALVSTFADVMNAVNAAAAAGLLPAPSPNSSTPIMLVNNIGGDLTEIVAASGPNPLSNGAADPTPQVITGTLVGEKLFEDC